MNFNLILRLIKAGQCATQCACMLLVHFENSESLTMEIT